MKAYANADLAVRLERPFLAVCDGDMKSDPTKNQNIKRFIENSDMPESKVVFLERPSIEHYLAVPEAIHKAFPAIDLGRLEQVLKSNEGKKNLKNMFKELFISAYGRTYTEQDLHEIANSLKPEDIPSGIREIISRLRANP